MNRKAFPISISPRKDSPMPASIWRPSLLMSRPRRQEKKEARRLKRKQRQPPKKKRMRTLLATATAGGAASSKIPMPTIGNISLYFHVPFCSKKCPYCHFFVLPNDERLKKPFVTALLKEW